MYQRQVTFNEAINLAVKDHYCDFNGRASRSEFWWFALFSDIIGAIFYVLMLVFADSTLGIMIYGLNVIVGLALLLPSFGLAVRRLHDIGRSGWWLLIGLIPLVGMIILIVWFCKESQMETNEYGEVPNMTA